MSHDRRQRLAARSRHIPLLLWSVALGAGLAAPAAAGAQSLTAGSLRGTVRDSSGGGIPGASVTVTDVRTGVRRGVETPREGGAFAFALLFPGEYDVRVERFGYRPVLMRRVPVRAGAVTRADVVLVLAAPTVPVDTVGYEGAPAGGSHATVGGGTAADDVSDLAQPLRLVSGLGTLFSDADAGLGAEGLPGRMGALAVDGITRWSPRSPRLAGAALDGIAFPLAAFSGAERLAGGMDAEWPGAGGGVVAGSTVPGAREFQAAAAASGGADAQYAALRLGGPVVRDTAQFTLGIAATRYAPALPAPWPASAEALAAQAIARDSFRTDLSRYAAAYRPATTIVSGFGRFDWWVTGDHRLSIRMDAGSATLDDPALGLAPAALGSRLLGSDLSAAAALTSTISRAVGNELSAAVDAGTRELSAAPFAGTLFTGGGFAAGTPSLGPGTFQRTTFHLGETLHDHTGIGAFKAGVQADFSSHDQTFDDDRAGGFVFGDTTDFARRRGAFRQAVGSVPVASFPTTRVGLFAQGLFQPAPALEVTLGVRYDAQRLPADRIPLNTAWAQLTHLANAAVPPAHGLVSPRVTFTWTLGARGRWHVVGEAGTFQEAADPGELAEAIVHSGGVLVRRGFGSLGAWPAPPDSTAAPVQGPTLTLLGPRFVPPRTGRARLGLGGNVAGAALRIEGTYRHTDFLPIRRDLNLPISSRERDQYGRQLYGTLEQSGSLLGVAPGSNRRFSGFDAVYSLDPAGYSDYWGLTVSLEREVERGLTVLASYTYSQTRDNWFGARSWSADGQLVPFTDSTGASPWAKGTSDFDVPHRVVVGVEQRFGGALGLRIALLYRWRSGYPFTPGFRDGVDANGDGSGRNDPAFVDTAVVNGAAVVAANACLRAQIGGFAARNSCREPGAGGLELRLAFSLGARTDVFVDGLDLATTGGDVVDHALYLVDPAGSLYTNPATGVTTVPLIANPNFNRTLTRTNPGAMWRLGLRVRW